MKHLALHVFTCLYLFGCASEIPTAPVAPPSAPYASWPNQEWAKAAEAAVIAEGLDKIAITDGRSFCPNGMHMRNWVHLLGAVARYESNFKPDLQYTEAFKGSDGKNVISRGLFQISFSSTQQARYGCKWSKQTDLHDPIRNIQCSAKVARALVTENKQVTNHTGTAYRGMARYWSVMRPNRTWTDTSGRKRSTGKLTEIKARLKGHCE